MGDQIANAASKLVPLMLVVVAVFGLLILAALLLRWKIRAESALVRRRARRRDGGFETGDVVSVLGRLFNVTAVRGFDWSAEKYRLLELDGENGQARVVCAEGAEQAMYFPGRTGFDGKELPDVVEGQGRRFMPVIGPVETGSGRIAIYSSDEVYNLLEEGQEGIRGWKGKSIPAEGLEVVG